MSSESIIETDVLVIGGGIAGCFAAIKAKEKGLKVTLVDKGYVSKSGQTPFAGTFAVYNPGWGHNLEEWMDQVNRVGEYVNNRTWTELAFMDSYDRYTDLVSWGVEFDKDDEGNPHRMTSRLGPCQSLHMEWRKFAGILREVTIKKGVKILDKHMITHLLKQEKSVVGAVGFPVGSHDICIFKAKAIVMAGGAGGFKPPGWPIHGLTSDADVMAYRIGAEITGKEFSDPHPTSGEAPAYFGNIMKDGHPIFGKLFNAENSEIKGRGTLFLDLEFEAHAGRAPITLEHPGGTVQRVGGGASGMSVHKAEGIWPTNSSCATGIPGLYTAGDCCGTMQSGAVYASIGMSLSGASVTGARAGWGAADHALKIKTPTIDENKLDQIRQNIIEPTERKGGFSPRWVTQVLQNTMIPYYIMYIKKEDRMQAALTIVEFIRDHLLPKLMAKDPHELRLAHETKNMVLNAEMRLRASLFRTESRGCHYREDFPRRDDPNWLAWVKLKQEDGKMKVFKESIPEEWWPDLSMPYEERYPIRLPGE